MCSIELNDGHSHGHSYQVTIYIIIFMAISWSFAIWAADVRHCTRAFGAEAQRWGALFDMFDSLSQWSVLKGFLCAEFLSYKVYMLFAKTASRCCPCAM